MCLVNGDSSTNFRFFGTTSNTNFTYMGTTGAPMAAQLGSGDNVALSVVYPWA
jgi:hypothetical protein